MIQRSGMVAKPIELIVWERWEANGETGPDWIGSFFIIDDATQGKGGRARQPKEIVKVDGFLFTDVTKEANHLIIASGF